MMHITKRQVNVLSIIYLSISFAAQLSRDGTADVIVFTMGTRSSVAKKWGCSVRLTVGDTLRRVGGTLPGEPRVVELNDQYSLKYDLWKFTCRVRPVVADSTHLNEKTRAIAS